MLKSHRLLAFLFLIYGIAGIVRSDASPEALMEAGHWKRARAAVEAMAQRQPGDAQVLYLQSRIRLAFGNAAEAQKLAEAAVVRDEKNPRYQYQLAEACIAQINNAGMFKGMSISKCARKGWEAAIALDPKYIEPRESLAEYYAEAPGIAGGDKDKARAMADEVASLDAVRGHLVKAQLAQAEKAPDRAAAAYAEAAKAGPYSYTALAGAAFFFVNQSNPNCDSAEKYAHDAHSIDPSRTGAYIILAQCAARGQKWNALDQVLGESESKVPDDFSPYYQAGKTLLLAGNDLRGQNGISGSI